MVEFTIHSLLTIVIYLYVQNLSALHSWKITKKSHLHVLQLLLSCTWKSYEQHQAQFMCGCKITLDFE